MDFKLCGTDAGVTGFQLDLKLPGIPLSHHGRGDRPGQEDRAHQILAVMDTRPRRARAPS